MWSLGRQRGWEKWEGREAKECLWERKSRERKVKSGRQMKGDERESWRKSTCVLEKGPSHRLRRRVERASVSGQDEMVDCVWTTSRKYLEWIGRASRPLRATLLIMAVGAVGTSLNTERTLLIRRHVTAHPCRVNTLHSNDYSLFLPHTQTHTNLAVTLSLSLIHRRTHGYTDVLHTKQSCFSFFVTCTVPLC